MIDCSKGRYMVKDANGALIGRIDEDEYVRRSGAALRFRIDGAEFYTLDCVLIGFIRSGMVIPPEKKRV